MRSVEPQHPFARVALTRLARTIASDEFRIDRVLGRLRVIRDGERDRVRRAALQIVGDEIDDEGRERRKVELAGAEPKGRRQKAWDRDVLADSFGHRVLGRFLTFALLRLLATGVPTQPRVQPAQRAFTERKRVSSEFLICVIAVRPMPESSDSSLALNCRCGNFSARKSSAAKVVAELIASSSSADSISLMTVALLIGLWAPFDAAKIVFGRTEEQPCANGHFLQRR